MAADATMFIALVGATTDGHDHVASARDNGAVAALVSREVDVADPQVVVPDTREAAGPAAAWVHGDPASDLRIIGTTGTNGKTTISWMVESAAAAAGHGTGMIGTVATRINGTQQAAVRTTPEGPDLQRLLATMRDRGADVVAMEVSSHGLDLHRVDGTRFAVAVFTNLTQDHLDFHETFEDYFAAKARLFTPELSDRAVIGVFDDWGRRLAATTSLDKVTIGEDDDADIRLSVDHAGIDGSRGRLLGPAEWLGGATQRRGHDPVAGSLQPAQRRPGLGCRRGVGVGARRSDGRHRGCGRRPRTRPGGGLGRHHRHRRLRPFARRDRGTGRGPAAGHRRQDHPGVGGRWRPGSRQAGADGGSGPGG